MSGTSQQAEIARALQRLEEMDRELAFDPSNLESLPTPKQAEVLADFSKIKQQWIRSGNQSGKSQTAARMVGWLITETHPTWKRPDSWGSEPLLVIVAGRTGKQIEDSLLPKLRGFLKPGTYKEVRIGNIIQRVELANGNRIIFQSLENPNTARERLQSYVAHMVWVDELPPTMDIIRELLIRVQARDGYFVASFTPTIISADIQRYVDNLTEPDGKVYRFHMLDNPLYADPVRKQELIRRYEHLPEHVQKSIFEGEWISSDDQVYYFNYATMVEMPADYSTLSWRHVLSVDPALKSALGFTVWAENPITSNWYCVEAEYIRGIHVPTELVTAVELKASKYNIVRRIADPHEVWYIQTAASMGKQYVGVYKKNERKSELIKQLQEGLGSGRVKLSPNCQLLISELQECRFSDRAEGRIVNSSSYHLLDASQYFVDNIPRPETRKIVASSWDEWLYKANEDRLIQEQKEQQRASRPGAKNRRPKIVNRGKGSLWKLF